MIGVGLERDEAVTERDTDQLRVAAGTAGTSSDAGNPLVGAGHGALGDGELGHHQEADGTEQDDAELHRGECWGVIAALR